MRGYAAVIFARSVRRALSAIQLARPDVLVALAIAVLFGALLAEGDNVFREPSSSRTVTAALSLAFLAAAGLAPGSIARLVPAVVGIALASAVSFVHAGVAIVVSVLLYIRNARFAGVPFVRSLITGTVAALAIVYGALSAGIHAPVWMAAAFVWMLALGRDLLNAVGPRAGMVTAAVTILAVLASPIPFLYHGYGGIYLVALVVTDAILLRAVWLLVTRPAGYAERTSHALMWGLSAGLLSLALYWVG